VEHAQRQVQLAAIVEEMNAIHTANKLYWNQKEHNHKEDMRHQRRQKRLEPTSGRNPRNYRSPNQLIERLRYCNRINQISTNCKMGDRLREVQAVIPSSQVWHFRGALAPGLPKPEVNELFHRRLSSPLHGLMLRDSAKK